MICAAWSGIYWNRCDFSWLPWCGGKSMWPSGARTYKGQWSDFIFFMIIVLPMFIDDMLDLCIIYRLQKSSKIGPRGIVIAELWIF
jgi:hypothetical protein